jgi:hypothetical protein
MCSSTCLEGVVLQFHQHVLYTVYWYSATSLWPLGCHRGFVSGFVLKWLGCSSVLRRPFDAMSQ